MIAAQGDVVRSKGGSVASVRRVINARRDALGTIYMRQRPVNFDPAVRFMRLQRALIHRELGFVSPAATLAAFLIAFDGVVLEDAVGAALAGAQRAYVVANAVHIDWVAADGRGDSRELGALTIACLTSIDRSGLRPQDWKQDLAVSLRPIYGGEDPVAAFLGDATRWVSSHVVQPLVAHVTRLAPMTCPPRTALARRATGRTLKVDERDVDLDEVAIGLGNGMAGVLTSPGQDMDQYVLDRLVSACRPRGNGIPGVKRRAMLQAALELVREAVAAGPVTALIVCWAVDLIESGTAHERNLSPNTIKNYVPVVARKLFPRLRGNALMEMGSAAWADLYESICMSVPAGQRSYHSSALRAWHVFLEGWLDVAPLARRLAGSKDDVPPKANLVWPQERGVIEGWLADATIDDRLVGQLRVAFAIGFAARIRIGELLMLRLRNVDDERGDGEDAVVINLSDGLKSESARRPLQIRDNNAREILREWIARRRREGALSGDYLFGDPHEPGSVYRIGLCCVLLNRILKAATGDPAVSFHTLSHTWLSVAGETALNNRSIEEVRRLDADVAMPGGHLSNHTSASHYMHLFVGPLRMQLDTEIRRLNLTSEVAAGWCTVSAAALRKRVERRAGDVRTVFWDAIDESRDLGAFESVDAGIALEQPAMPAFLKSPIGTSFRRVLHALKDLASGRDIDAVALRSGQPVEWVAEVVQQAAHHLEVLGVTPSNPATRAVRSTERDVATLVSCFGSGQGHLDFGRSQQPKFERLAALLESGGGDDVVEQAHRAWIASMRSGYLGLDSARSAIRIFALLERAGVRSGEIALAIAEGASVGGMDGVGNVASGTQVVVPFPSPQLVDDVRDAFAMAYVVPPIEIPVVARRGRPPIYLVWSSGAIGFDPAVGKHVMPPPAAAGLAGFHALMLAAGVHAALRRCQRE
jgi:integrase